MTDRIKVTLLDGDKTNKNLKPTTEEGSRIAYELTQTFLDSIEDKQLHSFALMQALVQFFVGITMSLEESGEVPDSFRKVLMRNVELNFDYKDGKEAGIDLSDVLLQGVIDDDERGLLD